MQDYSLGHQKSRDSFDDATINQKDIMDTKQSTREKSAPGDVYSNAGHAKAFKDASNMDIRISKLEQRVHGF